jgi:hypothetical protein
MRKRSQYYGKDTCNYGNGFQTKLEADQASVIANCLSEENEAAVVLDPSSNFTVLWS